jgi:hypothetical protein
MNKSRENTQLTYHAGFQQKLKNFSSVGPWVDFYQQAMHFLHDVL